MSAGSVEPSGRSVVLSLRVSLCSTGDDREALGCLGGSSPNRKNRQPSLTSSVPQVQRRICHIPVTLLSVYCGRALDGCFRGTGSNQRPTSDNAVLAAWLRT